MLYQLSYSGYLCAGDLTGPCGDGLPELPVCLRRAEPRRIRLPADLIGTSTVPLNGWAEARKGLIAGRPEFPGAGEARMRLGTGSARSRRKPGAAAGRFSAGSRDCFHMRRNTRESQGSSHPNQEAGVDLRLNKSAVIRLSVVRKPARMHVSIVDEFGVNLMGCGASH
ncbi:hypothetical protein [Cereibacter changlensis]|uniref:hypothetical protein n=1 Tax=Cereibacter changlensis TaxID=402884 RepID=UPI0011B284A5|nr:hypothetical protein [Cereibacter changlensis]